MAEELELLVEGRTYSGWESVTFFRTIEACSGSFSVEIADLPSWRIVPGMQVQALVDGEPFATGWIDSVKRSLDKDGRKLSIEGRDRSADLVDCSALIEAGEVYDVSLVQLVALLADPFGVEVQFASDVEVRTTFDLIAINTGETAWEVLERCLRMRGLLAFSRGTGELFITRPSSAAATSAIVEGVNLKSGQVGLDSSSRFRSYTVTGQRRGNDDDFGDVVGSPQGLAQDAGARAARVLIIQAEQSADDELCQRRAEWEATTRAARSANVSCTVVGWRRPGGTTVGRPRPGPLWTVNERVRFASPTLRVDEELLVASCRYRLSKDQGHTTEMVLVRPDAFVPEPIVEPSRFGDYSDAEIEEETGQRY